MQPRCSGCLLIFQAISAICAMPACLISYFFHSKYFLCTEG
ncbi:hypothetical protein [Polaromonas sp. CG9_12]|nr:hypothetical protein [Polaromonas sp. CG9_12]